MVDLLVSVVVPIEPSGVFGHSEDPIKSTTQIAQESTHKVVNIINTIKPASILQRKAAKTTALKGMQIASLLL